MVGWSMILGYPASAAFYLASFSDWFDRFIVPLVSSGLGAALPFWTSGVVVLGLLVGLNLKGTEESGQFQILVTALKVGLIVVFLYGGRQAFEASTIQQSVADNPTAFPTDPPPDQPTAPIALSVGCRVPPRLVWNVSPCEL